MAENPKIDGFEEVSVGYNYIELSLALLKVTAGVSAELEISSGFTFSVTIGGSYSTKFGPSIAGTVWLGGIATLEYAAAGSTSVKIDGNPITLQTAVAESKGTAAQVHSAGARLLAGGLRLANRLSRANARGARVQNSGASNSMGGSVSTGGSG